MNYSQIFNFVNVLNNNCNYKEFKKIYNNTSCKDILNFNNFNQIFTDLIKYLEKYDNINYIELFYNDDIINGLNEIINKDNILLLNNIFNFLLLDENIYKKYILSSIVFFNFNQDELEKIKNTEFYNYINTFFCNELLPYIYLYSNYFIDEYNYKFGNNIYYIRDKLHQYIYGEYKYNNGDLNKICLLNKEEYKIVNKILQRYNNFANSWTSIWNGFCESKYEDNSNLSKIENLINKCKWLDDDEDENNKDNNNDNNDDDNENENDNNNNDDNDNDDDNNSDDDYDYKYVSYRFTDEEKLLMNKLVTKYKINKYLLKKQKYDNEFTLNNNINFSNVIPEISIALNRFNPEDNLVFNKKNINDNNIIKYLKISELCNNTKLFKNIVEYYDVKNIDVKNLKKCYCTIHNEELKEYFYNIVKINNPSFTKR